ncbi:LOW QUALITY PROTEIN: uncharacterized protein LOC118017101 [Mirounga leonina]|uniref:LOW QUALITY PROTEIN: uncharacterized protein LOC118017101 n=1 Tax=Mirounga leonina TaxID=9715 RepID=UPI00156C4981|nr:LOW QUALITY PROTEIN: uncharacterized protein LOC118017101 [Mirounga leonina]
MSQEHQTDKTTTHQNRQTTEQEHSSVGDSPQKSCESDPRVSVSQSLLEEDGPEPLSQHLQASSLDLSHGPLVASEYLPFFRTYGKLLAVEEPAPLREDPEPPSGFFPYYRSKEESFPSLVLPGRSCGGSRDPRTREEALAGCFCSMTVSCGCSVSGGRVGEEEQPQAPWHPSDLCPEVWDPTQQARPVPVPRSCSCQRPGFLAEPASLAHHHLVSFPYRQSRQARAPSPRPYVLRPAAPLLVSAGHSHDSRLAVPLSRDAGFRGHGLCASGPMLRYRTPGEELYSSPGPPSSPSGGRSPRGAAQAWCSHSVREWSW